MSVSYDFDICIIGAGAVGLALAWQLSDRHSVLLVEQHARAGEETSSRNSEVIHAGLYYPHGSLKQRWCLRGKALLYDFCQLYQVPHRRIGKLLVAQPEQLSQLRALQQHAQSIGVEVQQLTRQQLQLLEPAVEAHSALLSPSTGIIDSHALLQRLEALAAQQGALLHYRCQLKGAKTQPKGWTIQLNSAGEEVQLSCRTLINSAGLYAQQVAHAMGLDSRSIPLLYPCRGQYFSYHGKSPVRTLVYPMPDAQLAGLGIHATLDMVGQLRFGPDAHYQDSRSDYRVDPSHAKVFGQAIKRYLPAIDTNKLQPDYSGIRPKLAGPGMTAADFQLRVSHNNDPSPYLHLFGIESPGLTSCLAIAESVTEWLQKGDAQPLLAT